MEEQLEETKQPDSIPTSKPEEPKTVEDIIITIKTVPGNQLSIDYNCSDFLAENILENSFKGISKKNMVQIIKRELINEAKQAQQNQKKIVSPSNFNLPGDLKT